MDFAQTLNDNASRGTTLAIGDALEALFPNGELRARPTTCSTCEGPIKELLSCYIVDDLPVQRSYFIKDVYDRPECLPASLAALRGSWDGRKWACFEMPSGVQIDRHPLLARELTIAEEAILLLAPHQRQDAHVVQTIRCLFESPVEALRSEEAERLFSRTAIAFRTGHLTTIADLLVAHQAHFGRGMASAGEGYSSGVYPSTGELFRCWLEESALLRREEAAQ